MGGPVDALRAGLHVHGGSPEAAKISPGPGEAAAGGAPVGAAEEGGGAVPAGEDAAEEAQEPVLGAGGAEDEGVFGVSSSRGAPKDARRDGHRRFLPSWCFPHQRRAPWASPQRAARCAVSSLFSLSRHHPFPIFLLFRLSQPSSLWAAPFSFPSCSQ